MWAILRGKQVDGLKFRRQHPIAPFIADFACVSKKLAVEIDCAYHDQTCVHDIERELLIRKLGWDVIRFSGSDVEADPEAVARAVFERMGMQLEFKKRLATGFGMMATKRSAVGRPSLQSRLRTSPGRVISK